LCYSKDRKLLKSLKFPNEFQTKVELQKVNWEVMKSWIATRITELLGGVEDEVLIAYVYEQLEGHAVSLLEKILSRAVL
jgi:serine/arginine repetitive matrix protein 1